MPVVITALGLLGIAASIARPVIMYARMNRAEKLAAITIAAVVDAERAFRSAGGNGGFASDLASLTTPCPGQAAPALVIPAALSGFDYAVSLRPAEGATTGRGADCHGRPTTMDFYAAVAPLTSIAGRQAFAVTARGRAYVFFDGLPPRERDMSAGGLAIPADRLPVFRIP